MATSTTTTMRTLNNGTLPPPAAFYKSSASPCFAAGQVRLADGWCAPVDSIFAGDRVATSNGGSARVECVIVTECENGVEALVELNGGVFVTPWRPTVRVAGGGDDDWKFPTDLAPIKLLPCSRVYGFVLEDGASDMVVGPYEVLSLGQGDLVAAAQNYDFAPMAGWKQGRFELRRNPTVREAESERIARTKISKRQPQRPTTAESCGHADESVSKLQAARMVV